MMCPLFVPGILYNVASGPDIEKEKLNDCRTVGTVYEIIKEVGKFGPNTYSKRLLFNALPSIGEKNSEGDGKAEKHVH